MPDSQAPGTTTRVMRAAAAEAALGEVGDAVVVLDRDARVLWFNPVAGMLCRLADEDVGSRWSDHLPPGAADEAAALEQALGGAMPGAVDSVRIDRYGMSVHVSVTVVPVFEQDELVGACVVARDLSEQQLLQEAMAEMARRSDEIQSLSKVGLWIWDRTTDNIQWTPELYRIHGIDPFDFEGNLAAHLAPIVEGEREHVADGLGHVLDTGEEGVFTYPIDTPDGRRWVRSSVRVAQDEAGSEGLVGTCQDVTEQQRYAEAIEAANKELERFASAAAHDLKTPLTVIVGMADLLRDLVGGNDAAEMMVKKIIEAGQNASDMIAELIESARADALRRSMAPVDLNSVLTRVRTSLQPQLSEADGRLVIGRLPVVLGSPALVRQLFFNLVGNAIKYRNPERDLVVEVHGEERQDVVVIVVEDNGLGIPPEHRESVFGQGVRVHTGLGVEGDGLGLSTCREIVEQHGGTLAVGDGVDGGTAMIVTLSRHRAAEEPDARTASGWLSAR